MNPVVSVMHFAIISYLKFFKDKDQKVFIGKNSIFETVKELKKLKHKKIFIVTDENIVKLNLISSLIETLKSNLFDYYVYSEVKSDPNIETVEKGFNLYNENQCDCIVAIGGGSVIDCAKAIGARVNDPKRSIKKMKRLVGGVRRKSPYSIAIPTTSGTGSENTYYALISNDKTKEKYPLLSNKFVPDCVALNPYLTVNLPLSITATTGMDALAHAVESYVSTYSKFFKKDKKHGLEATKLIIDNLEKVYKEPTNLKYRENMLVASYRAGLAFRKISIGYIHAIAHRMGEFYHIAHGEAIAIIFPYVLEFMKDKALDSLSELALYCKLGNKDQSKDVLADLFIAKVKEMNKTMKIPTHIKKIKQEDYPLLIKRILKEGRLCGNPRMMNKKECAQILDKIKGVKNV